MSRQVRLQLLFGFVLSLSGSASWAAALSPEVVGSYLSKIGGRVLIVAAGDWQSSKEMALAIERAIIDSGHAENIESGAQLGEIDSLSDQEILSRLRSKHLDEIVVVRAVPGAPSLANVRFYDAAGAMLTEFQFGPGIDLLPRVHAVPPSLADFSSLGDAAGDYDEEPISMQRSRRFFSKSHLDVRDVRMVSWSQSRGRWRKKTKIILAATQGNAEALVPWDLFYELVNRPDLLLQYHQRQVNNYRLVVAGGVVAAIAVPLLIAAGATATQDDKRIPYSLAGAGCGLALTGVIQTLVGAFRSPHPVEREELEQLAQVHNSKLPQPPMPTPEPPSLPPPQTVE